MPTDTDDTARSLHEKLAFANAELALLSAQVQRMFDLAEDVAKRYELMDDGRGRLFLALDDVRKALNGR